MLGAAGTIGAAIVADLVAGGEVDELTLLDRDGTGARAVGLRFGAGGVQVAAVDGGDRQALTLAIEGHQVLVNAAGHATNLAAMDAALAADCSYVDLGGPSPVTAQQLRLDEGFAQRGLVSIVGCGAAPGQTNVMAARGAHELDAIETIRCSAAGGGDPEGLGPGSAVVRDAAGRVPVPPDGGRVRFPDPVGALDTLCGPHAEVLTLPGSLGATTCDFRWAHRAGMTHAAQHVELNGVRDGAPRTVTVTAVTPPDDVLRLDGEVRCTATFAAAVVRLLARGDLRRAGFGVLAPERALTPAALLPELEARGCRFSVSVG